MNGVIKEWEKGFMQDIGIMRRRKLPAKWEEWMEERAAKEFEKHHKGKKE